MSLTRIMVLDNNQKAFFSLVQAGLWGQEVRLLPLGMIDFSQVLSLAEEQSVVGLIAAGIERVCDTKVAKADVIQFIGQSLQLEQQNTAMNCFIGVIVDKMRKEGIYTLLVKGQGIAQCYEKPLWRACGDVDLLLNMDNYQKAKAFFLPLAVSVDEEDVERMHLGMTIDSWVVELHGTLKSRLGRRIDKEIDAIQDITFREGQVRSWRDGETDVFLPAPDNDAIFIFTHILQHFFKGGIGLKQICDLCRLLWTYRDSIDITLLERRLRKMGLMSEWRAFASLSVVYLGMPVEAMPLYSSRNMWSRKASRIVSFILKTGSFGRKRDKSYYEKYPVVIYKAISFWNNTKDSILHFAIFPIDAVRVWFVRFKEGIVQVVTKGK